MYEQSIDENVFKFLAVLEQKVRSITTKKLKIKPTTSMGSYVDMSRQMVKVDEAIEVIKNLFIDPELQGVTSLPEKLWQEIEKKFRRLPIKRIKIDPLQEYNKSASLYLEEDYVEVNDAIELMRSLESSLGLIESAIVEFLCGLIELKEEKLAGRRKGDRVYLEKGEMIDTGELPELKGTKKEVERGEEIRAEALVYLLQSEVVSQLSPTATAYMEATIKQMTSASWWIKNEHRTIRAILLQISKAIDEALLKELASL